MIVPVVLFGIAALGGLGIAVMRFQGKPYPPMVLALVHGAVAAAGLVVLALAVINGTTADLARIALGIFVIAALGGFALFSFHLRKKPLPIGLVVGHALIAVIGYLLLLKVTFGS